MSVGTPTESCPCSGWAIGICSVLFDIDKGQTLQHLHPLGCISHEEESSVAFHSFPDSLSMELYARNAIKDSSFHFRVKRIPLRAGADGHPAYLHGYVFCRQRQDETLRRGGEQASVVVLSELPISNILLPLSQAAGHTYFNEGPTALEKLYQQVQSWPAPAPGSHMSLPADQAIIAGRIPYFILLPPPQPTVDPIVKAQLNRRVSCKVGLRRGLSSNSNLSRCSSNSSNMGSGQATPAAAVGDEQQVSAAAAAADADWSPTANGADNNNKLHRSISYGATGVSPTGSGSWSSLADQSAAAAAAADGPKGVSRLQHSSSNNSRSDINGVSSSAGDGSNDRSRTTVGNQAEDCARWITSSLGQNWKLEVPDAEVDIAAVLGPLLRHLWSLWQLLVTGQPLMVVGLTPRETSVAVSALLCLISPLPYAADYRPYFTIHDQDFIAISRGKLPTRQIYHEQQQPPPAAAAAAAAVISGSTQSTVPPLEQQPAAAAAAVDNTTVSTHEQHNPATEQNIPLQLHPANNPSGASALEQQVVYQEQFSEPEQSKQLDEALEAAAAAQVDTSGRMQSTPAAEAAGREYEQQQQQQQQGPDLPALLGVTNLYFIKALPNFPNVVAISKKDPVTHGSVVPALLGVNNLYFIKALPNFPNVVAVSKKDPVKHGRSNSFGPSSSSSSQLDSLAAVHSAASTSAAETSSSSSSSSPATAAAAAAAGRPTSPAPTPRRGLISSTAAAAVRALRRRHHGPQHLLSEFSHHLWCTSKVLIKPDHQVIASVTAAMEKERAAAAGGSAAAAAAAAGCAHRQLKRHFAKLTAAFLEPFSGYLQPGDSGTVSRWCPDTFLQSLTSQASALPPDLTARLASSSAAVSLYRAFLESPNFEYWFRQHRQPVMHLIELEHAGQQDIDGFTVVDGDTMEAAGTTAAADGKTHESQSAEDVDEVMLVQTLLSAEQELAAALAEQQQQHTAAGPGEPLLLLPGQQQQHWQQCDEVIEQQLRVLALQIRLVSAFTALPEDVQVAMVTNPSRRQLLEESVCALGTGSDDTEVTVAGGVSDDVAGLQQMLQRLRCTAENDSVKMVH